MSELEMLFPLTGRPIPFLAIVVGLLLILVQALRQWRNTIRRRDAGASTLTQSESHDGEQMESKIDAPSHLRRTRTRLLPAEHRFLHTHQRPISTITWFRGDHKQAAIALKHRVQLVLISNPWLANTSLVTQPPFHWKTWLEYNDDPSLAMSSVDRVFNHIRQPCSNLHRNTPLEQLEEATKEFRLPNTTAKNKTQIWCRITVIPCFKNPDQYFAVVLSLSHILTDGYTFYKLYCMLLRGSLDEIRALKVKRDHSSEKQLKKALGPAEYSITRSLVAFPLNFVLGYLRYIVRPHHKAWTSRMFQIDAEEMRLLKLQYADNEHPFISSNDMITSWFFQKCGCQYGLMVIELRNRLAGTTTRDHAGNYHTLLFFENLSKQSPLSVRTKVETWNRASQRLQVAPTLWQLATGTYAIANNLAFLQQQGSHTCFPNCTEEAMLPCFGDLLHLLPCPTMNVCLCVIFRNMDKLTVWIGGPPHQMKRLKNAPFEKL